MNLLVPILDHPLTHRIAWALLHSIWEGAVVAAVFAILQLNLRHCSANVRYVAGCASLAVLLTAPVITLLWLPIEPGSAMLSQALAKPVIARRALENVASVVRTSPTIPSDYPRQIRNLLDEVLPWLTPLWAIGVAGLSVRWTLGNRWIKRVTSMEVEPLGTEWFTKLQNLSRRLGITRHVHLLKSTLVEVPLVVGWIRPIILLPASALTRLTPDQLESILAHELAHVRRHDYVVNLCQTFVETLMFYHPAVWWISRYVREEREHCCDDLVVRVCGDRVAYVHALVTMEQARGISDLAFAATGGSLLHRVRRLVGVGKQGSPPSAAEFGGLTMIAIGSVLVLVAALLLLRPNIYQAVSLIRVVPSASALAPSGSGPSAVSDYFPYLLQTECMVIRSPAVLTRAIEATKAPAEQGHAPDELTSFDTLLELQKHITLVRVPETSLIEIRAVAPEPREAAQVANAVAVAYKEYRREQRTRSFSDSLHTLETRFFEHTQKVRQAAEDVDRLRIKLKVPDAVVNESMPTVPLSAETLRRIEGLRIESQAEYAKQKALLESLEKLDRAELSGMFQTVGINDAQLLSYLEAKSQIDQRLVSLRAEFGPQYPEIVKSEAVSIGLQGKIFDRADGILRGLKVKLNSTREGLDALSDATLRARTSELEATSRMQPYFAAKRDLEELQRFSSILQTKIAMEKTDEQLPVELVDVMEEARPPSHPLTPNRLQLFTLLGSGLILTALGFLLARTDRLTLAATKLA